MIFTGKVFALYIHIAVAVAEIIPQAVRHLVEHAQIIGRRHALISNRADWNFNQFVPAERAVFRHWLADKSLMRRGRCNGAVRFGERLLSVGVWRVGRYIQAAQLRPVAFGVVLCRIDAQLAHDVITREIS